MQQMVAEDVMKTENSEIVETLKCGNTGSMRRSKTANMLVTVSD